MNETSILLALLEKQDWGDVIERLQSYPEEASMSISREFDDGCNWPLHEACKLGPPTGVLEALLEAHPAAIASRGQWGYLPLHYACTSGASEDVVSLLLQTYVGGARSREDTGKLPLHLACKWGASRDVLRTLLQSYPEAIYMRDTDDKSAMDYVQTHTSRRDEMEAMLKLASDYCAVSKVAQHRVQVEWESKLQNMTKAHWEHIGQLERLHIDERARYEKKIQAESDQMQARLQAELEQEKNRSKTLVKQVEELQAKLDIRTVAMGQLSSLANQLQSVIEDAEANEADCTSTD